MIAAAALNAMGGKEGGEAYTPGDFFPGVEPELGPEDLVRELKRRGARDLREER